MTAAIRRLPRRQSTSDAPPTETLTRERYLSIPEVAEMLGTSERFPRRLVEERRIEFHRFGSHVRIAESALVAYVRSCTVPPIPRPRLGERVVS